VLLGADWYPRIASERATWRDARLTIGVPSAVVPSGELLLGHVSKDGVKGMRRFLAVAGLIVAAVPRAVPMAVGAAPVHASPTATGTVQAARISVKYLSEWVVAAKTDEGIKQQAASYAQTNPTLAARLSRPGMSAFDFFAIDPIVTPGYGNSNVAINFLPGVWNPRDGLAWVKSTTTDLAKADAAKAFDVKAVRVDGIAAYRIRMTLPFKRSDGSTAFARQGQLQIIDGKDETLVSVFAPDTATGRALVNSVLASVHHT
jgi:hypothetical protein